jgi:hypothetical protein
MPSARVAGAEHGFRPAKLERDLARGERPAGALLADRDDVEFPVGEAAESVGLRHREGGGAGGERRDGDDMTMRDLRASFYRSINLLIFQGFVVPRGGIEPPTP